MIVLAGFPWIAPNSIKAEAVTCSAQVSPNTVVPSTQKNYTFQIQNTSSSQVQWISIGRPSTNFIVNDISVAGWADATDENGTTLTLGTIEPNDTFSVVLGAEAAAVAAPAANWSVRVSNNPDGSSAVDCTGNLSTAIAGQAPDAAATITDITLVDLSPTEAEFTWSTSQPTSTKINYGISYAYGQSTPLQASLTTDHRVRISGLTPNTAYHYQAVGVDIAGNVAVSANNTFITKQSVSKPDIGTRNIGNPIDSQAPSISFSPPINRPYAAAPAMPGVARDDQSVARVEYSVDGGQNWLPAERIIGLNTPTANFTLQPPNLSDGNYSVLIRVFDGVGNSTAADIFTLVIDRLPPRTGGALLTAGNLVITPDHQSVYSLMSKSDYRITVPAGGGPTSIVVRAIKRGSSSPLQSFNLVKAPKSDRWSGIMSFQQPGSYSLIAESIDGAGQITEHNLGGAEILRPARIIYPGLSHQKSEITIFRRDMETKTWTKWDAAPTGQINPQQSEDNGDFRALLPSGQYYLKIKNSVHGTTITRSFLLAETGSLTADITLEPASKWQLGTWSIPLPKINLAQPSVQFREVIKKSGIGTNLIGNPLPSFNLKTNSGVILHSVDLLGKPTLLIYTATWSPPARSELAALAHLQRNRDINVIPLASLESPSLVSAYNQIGGYDLTWLTDQNGDAIKALSIQSLPTHLLVDRQGIIRSVEIGPLSLEELNAFVSRK